MNDRNLNRRDFLKGMAAGAIGIAAANVGIPVLADSGIYNPGTYSATARGMTEVTVTMTFDANSITEVIVDTSTETAGIGRELGERFASAILEAQSADVDVVSGATMTSSGVIEAAKACIAQAKGETVEVVQEVSAEQNADWLGEEPVIDDIAQTITSEVIVIGGGTAGLEVGGSLAEKGLNTLILEMNSDVSTLRNDWGAIGSKYQKAEGTEVDKRAVMNYHIMQNAGRFDQRLQKIWAEESAEAIDWVGGVIESYGGIMLHEGGYTPQFGPVSIPKFPTGHSAHFDNSEYPDGKSILKQYILDKGGQFRFNTKFIKFEYEDHKVTAAIAQDTQTGEYIRFIGEKGIVLATGGYQNNEQMMHALQPDTRCLYGMQIGSTVNGEGIKACLWMGASMDDVHSTMLFDRMGLAPSETQANFTTMAFFQIGSQPWLKVNLKGERFFNESGLYDYAPHAAAAQPGRLCVSVFDANYWQNITQFETMGCSRAYPFPNGTPNDGMYSYTPEQFESAMNASIEAMVEQGILQKADTLEELAEKMNLPVDTFVATVKRYNELAEKGDDEDFYKEAYRMIPLTTAPYYAIRNASLALNTMDGIRIDTHSRPIDANGVAFDGVYVIGDCSGSYFAYSYPNLCTGYAHGRTCTFARRVAREINGEEVKDYTIMATQNAKI
ncbi:MAG: FAD-binding protein [Clostridia bacterium]|nr:FAD-binding protein [Clostridia bacterium]